MVSKISSSEYLRRYDNMTALERKEYESRVGEWMRSQAKLLVAKAQEFNARMQNVLTISATWNDAECQAFEDGARLLSALVTLTDTWLPDMLYIKSAKRAIVTMYTAFDAVVAQKHNDTVDPSKEETAEGTGKATQSVGGKAADKGLTKDSVRMQAGEAKDNAYTIEAGGASSVSPDAKPTTVTSPAPARPKHIDQYVHLLPEKTQERAAKVKDLLRELDGAREKMRLLMDDPTAKDDDRAAWAKKATSIDNTLRKIYDELDAEWAKLVKQGRVVVDDLGNARVVPGVQTTPTPPNSGGEAAAAEEQTELTSEQKARRRELRKWLVDTRRGNGDTREEHVKKWQENFKEFLALEGDAAYDDEKIKAAAEHYGIELKGDGSQESGEKQNVEK